MALQAFLLELAKIFVGNSWSKTGSALALMGATALLGWLDQLVGFVLGIDIRQPPTWISFAVMLIGVGLLVWGYSKNKTSSQPNPYDIELMNRFRVLITENFLDFLRNHNFDTPWRRSRLDAVADLAEGWRGARYEFNDPEMNTALDRVKVSANQFEELVAAGSWPARNNAEMQTTKTDEDYRIGTQPATIKKIRAINESATALVNNIDALERLARANLRPPNNS